MRVHHLSCGAMMPLGKRLIEGTGKPWQRSSIPCHCLLLETENRLILVDSGFGLEDIAHPLERLGLLVQFGLAPVLDEQHTAIRQVERLGFTAGDVSDIVLTHLDVDHVGGVDDFPNARVHLLAGEADAARFPASVRDRFRYRGRVSLIHQRADLWREYVPGGDQWFGFPRVHQLDGISDDMFVVSLAGHSRGHAGVVIDTGRRDRPRWLVHAGDAYVHHEQMDPLKPQCPPLIRAFQNATADDKAAHRRTVAMLRALASREDVCVINAHSSIYLAEAGL